jgi:hypothetical protein
MQGMRLNDRILSCSLDKKGTGEFRPMKKIKCPHGGQWAIQCEELGQLQEAKRLLYTAADTLKENVDGSKEYDRKCRTESLSQEILDFLKKVK